MLMPSLRQADQIIRKFWTRVHKDGTIVMNKLFVEMLETITRWTWHGIVSPQTQNQKQKIWYIFRIYNMIKMKWLEFRRFEFNMQITFIVKKIERKIRPM